MSKGSNRRPGEGYADGWDRTFGKTDPTQSDDHWEVVRELVYQTKRNRAIALANSAIKYADDNHLVLTIERMSFPPLAMGNHAPVVTVWKKRGTL